jgi:hypothetical protein
MGKEIVRPIVDLLDITVPIKDRIESAKKFILESENAVQAGLRLKYLSKFTEELYDDKEVKEKITNDTRAFIDLNKDFKKVKYQSVYTNYDYSVCMHRELDQLVQIQKAVDERVKEIQKELNEYAKVVENKQGKMFENGSMVLETDTKNIIVEYDWELVRQVNGEEPITINPPKKYQTMGLKYYLNAK